MTPVCRAARAVIGLKVEPGGNRSVTAWSISGSPGVLGLLSVCHSFCQACQAGVPGRSSAACAKSLGLNDGSEARARMAPVLGSMAMTAPALAVGNGPGSG
jgi:hypothetical protein